MSLLEDSRQVIEKEISSLVRLKENMDSSYEEFVSILAGCQSRIILTGMGKSGHVCRKIVATMQSLGIKAYFIHPAEALHGDLGILTRDDLVVIFSNGGESSEVLSLIPAIQKIGARIVSIIGRKDSTLEKLSEKSYILPEIEEAYLGSLVPTSSTTVMMALGDAWAVSIAKMREFTATDFSVFHPNGLLGKRLTLQVSNLMVFGQENSVVLSGATVQQALLEMCEKSIGGVNVLNPDGTLAGIFTDGDLRRLFHAQPTGALDRCIDEFMTRKPTTITADQLVSEVIKKMNQEAHMYSFFPVLDSSSHLLGTLRLLDISKAGLLG